MPLETEEEKGALVEIETEESKKYDEEVKAAEKDGYEDDDSEVGLDEYMHNLAAHEIDHALHGNRKNEERKARKAEQIAREQYRKMIRDKKKEEEKKKEKKAKNHQIRIFTLLKINMFIMIKTSLLFLNLCLFIAVSNKTNAQITKLSDTIRNRLYVDLNKDIYFKKFKIYNHFIDTQSVWVDSFKTYIYFEITIYFGKSKYEQCIAQIPVIACSQNENNFCYNLNRNQNRQYQKINFSDCLCGGKFTREISIKFNRGTIIEKRKLFINPSRKH